MAIHGSRFKPWGAVGRVPVLMVGDAAGQVKVTTVGGTVTGIAGAEAAVKSLLNGKSYSAELRSTKRELDVHRLIRVLLDRLDNVGYDLLLNSVSGRFQELLQHHDRDSMTPVFWRLPFIAPKLFRAGMKCLRGNSANAVRAHSRHPRAKASVPVRAE